MSDVPSNPSAVSQPDRPRQHADYQLDCLEVWGGSTAIDSSLQVTGLQGWVWSRPAGTGEGGDVYLASMCACAEVSRFLLADVSGHGAEAAAIASRLRGLMRRHINKPDQTRLATAINRQFGGIGRYGRFATAILATFYPPSGHLILCNAGHPRPLHYQQARGSWSLLAPRPDDHHELHNLPFGIRDDVPYEQTAVRLRAGDMVLLYTDGLIEARVGHRPMLGERGLVQWLNDQPTQEPQALMRSLRRYVTDDQDPLSAEDDLTLLLLRADGSLPPRQGLRQRLRVTAKMIGLIRTRH